jgi:uncharacterized phage protein (TIGR02220 family)
MVKRITEHLNAQAGTTYRPSGKKLRELIKARVNDGATEADFLTVIDKKVREWKGTDMECYLRPLTLFGPKFDEYLGQLDATPPRKQRTLDLTDKARWLEGCDNGPGGCLYEGDNDD